MVTATMKIEQRNPTELKHYKLNAKQHPEAQVKGIVESIKRFGFIQPVVVDKNDEIIIGHGRTMAAMQAGLEEVPTVKLENLTEQEVKALRLIDNRIAETDWDVDLLKADLKTLDIELSDFYIDFSDILKIKLENDSQYTRKIDAPIYKITGEKPTVEQLYDANKYELLCKSINANENLSNKEKTFLLLAASRHIRFDFQQIAEFYAHSNKEVQQLMEDNALVIIDYNKAIADGFVNLIGELNEE